MPSSSDWDSTAPTQGPWRWVSTRAQLEGMRWSGWGMSAFPRYLFNNEHDMWLMLTFFISSLQHSCLIVLLNRRLLPLSLMMIQRKQDKEFFSCNRKNTVLWLFNTGPSAGTGGVMWWRSGPESPQWVHPNSCIASQAWLRFTKASVMPTFVYSASSTKSSPQSLFKPSPVVFFVFCFLEVCWADPWHNRLRCHLPRERNMKQFLYTRL